MHSEGIQTTKGKDRRTGYTNRGVEVNTTGLHFVLFVVALPQFRGGGKVLALGGIAPPLPLAGYGPREERDDANFAPSSKNSCGRP